MKTNDLTAQERAEAAEHIALEASRLMRLAVANNFSLLAHLIDMAVLEAWREASEYGDSVAAARTEMQIDGT